MPVNTTTANYARFMGKVDTSGGPDACWPWIGSYHKYGYGWFSFGGRQAGGPSLAHRWLLGYLRGEPLTSDEWACHHCDNPPCVNPAHLYVGDAVRNHRDMAERGRGRNQWSDATHCSRGHEFNDADTYVTPEGRRVCRACQRERSRIPGGYKDRTHCPQGHPYNEENTYVDRGSRSCRVCHRERERIRRMKRVTVAS